MQRGDLLLTRGADLNLKTDFGRFYFTVFSLVLVSIEKIHQRLEAVFHCISKHLEVCQKYSAARGFFHLSSGRLEMR